MKNSNSMNEKPWVQKEYLLEKLPGKYGWTFTGIKKVFCDLFESLPGKYGWTFTVIPEILPNPNAPFSWVKVRGSIDGYEIKKYHF